MKRKPSPPIVVTQIVHHDSEYAENVRILDMMLRMADSLAIALRDAWQIDAEIVADKAEFEFWDSLQTQIRKSYKIIWAEIAEHVLLKRLQLVRGGE